MSISEFLESKQITMSELEKNFELVKRVQTKGYEGHEVCPLCEDTINQYNFPSEPWTGVKECVRCKTIRIILFGDRMGGALGDTIDIYKEKI